MLVITYSITVGGLLLPIGSPPNLIGRELLEAETGEPITFFEWFVMALPIVLVMFVAVVVIVIAFNRPEVKEVEGVEEYVREERGKLGRLSRGEKNTLLVLAFALIGWFLPGLVGIVAGDDSNAYTQVRRPRTRASSRSSRRRCCSSCPSTGRNASSRSTGTRRARSTGAP